MGSLETSLGALVEIGKSGVTRPMLLKKNGKDTGNLIVTKAEIVGASQSRSVQPPTAQMAAASISAARQSSVVEQSTPAAIRNLPPMADPVATFVPRSPTVPSASYRSGATKKEMFLDYVSGGCELNVAVAIDFTGSNGDPRKEGSLHHVNPDSRNQYEQAIAAIVSILLNYDSDKKIPVLGFGAKYGGVVRHCFQCGNEAEADSLQGIMDAYNSVFKTGLIMSRPTVFNEVLEATAQRAQLSLLEAQKRDSQAYTILLILTDGAVSDVKATADCLNRISGNPLSVIIVGVGEADFGAMQHLDDSAGGTLSRDIVQFVAFNEHAHSSHSLTQATLEEVPEQLVEYFQRRNIDPLPPVQRGKKDSMASFDAEEEEEIDLSLDIKDEEIVVLGGGDDFVNGFNAR
eukprot:scaffold40347_cov55-Attheya_sp.AAC.3